MLSNGQFTFVIGMRFSNYMRSTCKIPRYIKRELINNHRRCDYSPLVGVSALSLKDMLFPAVVLILMSLPGAPLLSGQSGAGPSFSMPEVRGHQTPSQDSMYLIDGGSDFDHMENISSDSMGMLSYERNALVDHLQIEASSPSPVGPRTSITTYSGLTIFTYSFYDHLNSTVDFYFMYTNEAEGYTEGPVTIGTLPYSIGGYVDMDVRDDTVYFLMSNVSREPQQSGLFMKIVPLDDLFRANQRPMSRVDISGDISSMFKVLGTSIGAAVMWMEDGTGDIYSTVYDGTTFSNPAKIRSNAVAMFPMTSYLSGTERVLLIYSNLNGNEINITSSFNGGLSFGISMAAGLTGKGVKSISAVEGEGKLHIAVANSDEDLIYHFHSDDGSIWTSNGPITPYLPPIFGHHDEVQIAFERDNVLIAFEDADRVRGITSFNGGLTFSSVRDLSGTGYRSPMMDRQKGYIGFYNGPQWSLKRFELSKIGHLVTKPLSPVGVSSWDSIGFNIAGVGIGTRVQFRLLNLSGGNVYPGSGFEDISDLSNGTIHDIPVSKFIPLDNIRTGPDTRERSIKVEIVIDRDIEDVPVIVNFILDFQVKYPFRLVLDEDLYLNSYNNLTIEENGLTLERLSSKGTFVMGPVWREDDWPDILDVRLGAFSTRIGFRGEVLDRFMEPVEGFTFSNSNSLNSVGTTEQLKWNGRHFGDIPDTFDQIFLRFEISKVEPTADPYVEFLEFGYSKPPYLMNYMAPQEPVRRGESIEFFMEIADREDDQRSLKLEVGSKPAGQENWIGQDHIDGVLWNSTNWNVIFSPPMDAEVGAYDLRYWIEDLNGNVTGPIDLPFSIEVVNNQPQPPTVHVEPYQIRTGDEVFVVLDKHGSDLESGSDLSYRYTLTVNDEIFMEGEASGEPGMPLLSIQGNNISRDDHWEISISSYDGISASLPITLVFDVINSSPVDITVPEELEMQEDTNLTIRPLDWFEDIDGDPLDLSWETMEGLDAVSEGEVLTLSPWLNWNGMSGLELTVSDGEFFVRRHIKVGVLPVNDLPVLILPDKITMNQDEDRRIFICCQDPVDGDRTAVTSDILEVIGPAVVGENIMIYPNGSAWIRATNDMVGTYVITFTGTDGMVNITKELELEIINVNKAPLKPSITVEPGQRLLVGSSEVVLKGNCSDEDLIWGDVITYSWSSSVQGELGTGSELSAMLEPGTHLITLEVTDSGGLSSESTIELKVTGEVEREDEVISTLMLVIIVITMGIVIGSMIGYTIFRKAKGGEKGSDEASDEIGDKDEKEELNGSKEGSNGAEKGRSLDPKVEGEAGGTKDKNGGDGK